MRRIEDALVRAVSDLRRTRVPFALIGGLAVSTRSEPRFTRDLDLAVSVPDDDAAVRLVYDLEARGWSPVALVEQTATQRLATARLASEGEGELGVVLDLLFASSGIEPEIVEAAEALEVFPGLVVPVARAGHLVAPKILSRSERRPQDELDLASLVPTLDATETSRAREATELVERRGFARGRALRADLDSVLSRYASG